MRRPSLAATSYRALAACAALWLAGSAVSAQTQKGEQNALQGLVGADYYTTSLAEAVEICVGSRTGKQRKTAAECQIAVSEPHCRF